VVLPANPRPGAWRPLGDAEDLARRLCLQAVVIPPEFATFTAVSSR
jgi:hypothetical protein